MEQLKQLESCSKPSATLKNPCSTLIVSKLYEQRHETGDIKFIIESEEIPAHRCVLAALSPRYKAQFYGAMAEQNTINVVDVSADAFKEFLQFFYIDEVTLTVENIEDVLNLAKQSLVDEIIAECTKFLFDVIGMDKLIWFYRLAIKYDIESMKELCVKQIGAYIKSVFQSSDFLNCEQEMLCHILDVDSLDCNEVDVFDTCILWARTKCEQNGIEAASTESLRAALGDAIFKIRFCSMTAEKFATIGKSHPGLLSGQESIEVFQAILLKANGEVSSTFGEINAKPREPMRLILECSFSTGPLMETFWPDKSDFLYFSCDKTIDLNGFVICTRIDCDIDVQVEVSRGSKTFDFIKSISDDKTKVIFVNPIHVEANKWCRISVSSEQLLTHGFCTETRVEQNGISFNFNPDCSDVVNAITHLLYSTIN